VDAPEATWVDREVEVERLWLDDTSWVDVARGWLTDADDVFTALHDGVPWTTNKLWRYERWVEENRMYGFWAPGRGSAPHPAVVEAHRTLRHRYKPFDSVAFCLYRDGNDAQGFHRDQEMRWLEDTVIAVLSLGAQRPWRLRHRRSHHSDAPDKGTTHDLQPASGDLIVMGGRCQADWEHGVPPVRTPVAPRISLQWRWTAKTGRPQRGPGYGAPLSFSPEPGRGGRR
jgi:alkylated DNA repair dioxygenase AlkB